VNEKATSDKEAGHSATAPSVLEGFKKLDGTCAVWCCDFRAPERPSGYYDMAERGYNC